MKTLAMLGLAVSLLSSCATQTDPGTDDDYPFPTGEDGDGKADQITNLPVRMAPPIAGVFDQSIDHPRGMGDSVGTFKQRFWYSTEFAKSADSPVLFYFCGEAPCDGAYVATMADAAFALNASVVALEHRYYGESLPFSDLTFDHMKYLTIHNALEDAASFEAFAKAQLPLKGKWISVGGSYPGMLAAFYRQKHPELVVGAWASSAPVNVQRSFMGYDAIASAALGPTCTLLFQQALAQAGTQFDDPAKRDQLSMDLFGSPAPSTKAALLENMSVYAMQAAQYGHTRQLCAALLQDQDDPLLGVIEYLHPPIPGDPAPPNPAPPRGAIMTALAPPASIDNFSGSEWFYQVCTQVGFYQVHNVDRTQSIMSDLITERFWNDVCQSSVGTLPDIAATRAEFVDPLDRGEASHILFVNGSLDPWMTLSYTDSSAPAGIETFVVKTGSHCEDLESLQRDSVLGVFKVHKRFHDLARAWLELLR
jgi:pimeloyl-ACP methyl ester carboxylesterase